LTASVVLTVDMNFRNCFTRVVSRSLSSLCAGRALTPNGLVDALCAIT